MRSGWNASRPPAFAHAHEQDRPAGHLADRECGTSARVAIRLGQHDTRQVERCTERPRGIHRVLARHAVDDEQRLDRLQRRTEVPHLVHHLVVHVEPSGGIHQQHVVDAASASSSAWVAIASGARPGSDATTSMPSCWPSRSSCSIAAGR